MKIFIRKSGFRVGVQIFMVLLVVGMFLAACGSDDPFDLVQCSSNQCEGTDGNCYQCDAGYYCTTSWHSGCGTTDNHGVYCCPN